MFCLSKSTVKANTLFWDSLLWVYLRKVSKTNLLKNYSFSLKIIIKKLCQQIIIFGQERDFPGEVPSICNADGLCSGSEPWKLHGTTVNPQEADSSTSCVFVLLHLLYLSPTLPFPFQHKKQHSKPPTPALIGSNSKHCDFPLLTEVCSLLAYLKGPH